MILSLLACFWSAPPDARDQLRAYEREQVEQALETALHDDDLVSAGELCVHARRIALDTDGCARLLQRLPEASASVRIQVHATLYDAARTPEARLQHRAGAMEAAVAHRYTQDLDRARANQRGVTLAMAHHAMQTLRDEYVVALDDTVLLEAAARQLRWLGELPRSRIAPGEPFDVRLPPEGDFQAAFDDLVAQGVAADLPQEMVVAELVEAVFHAADTFSQPVWPAEVQSWDEHHSGSHPGRVGVSFDRIDGRVQVTSLHADGPAYRAGVHVGDAIVRVDQLVPEGEHAVEAVAAALQGEDGVAVELELERDGATLVKTLTRATLTDRTVFGYARQGHDWTWRTPDGVQLVRIGGFRPHTAGELVEAASHLDPAAPLILDLRGNVGGDLDAAVAILDLFQPSGPMLHLEGRVKPTFPEGWGHATPGGSLEHTPVAVLVDHQTASSAEILAGGLQQRGATVIGERTTGKGSSQVLRVDPEHGYALQFTNLYWALPDHTVVHRADDATTWGIQPDVVLPLSPTERYVVGVLQARREALRVHADGTPMAVAEPPLDPNLPAYPRDPQIDAARARLPDPG